MSTIILNNESKNQLSLIESLLSELKIKFEISKEEEIIKLSDFQKEQIQKGIDDIEDGRIISSSVARQEAEGCFRWSGQTQPQDKD